jgi:hypothetical protein
MSFLILFGYFRGLKLKQEKETEKKKEKKIQTAGPNMAGSA